jgi:hypothetical protein
VAGTFAGRRHVEWDNSAPMTPLAQMPFVIGFVRRGGLFDGLVADCPLHLHESGFAALDPGYNAPVAHAVEGL